jgi:hypothetical protein
MRYCKNVLHRGKSMKNYSFLLLVVGGLLPTDTMHTNYGRFKLLPHQPLKISVQSRDFIKTMLALHHAFIVAHQSAQGDDKPCVALLKKQQALLADIVQKYHITPAHLKTFQEQGSVVKKILLDQSGTVVLHAYDQVWYELWHAVYTAVLATRLYNHEHEARWLKNQLQHFHNVMTKDMHDSSLPITTMRIVESCCQLLHDVDGVNVTEYDVLVLSELMLVLMALKC